MLVRNRPRPEALDRLRAEPRDSARRGQLAAQLGHELRRAPSNDAVQGQVRRPGVRLGRASSRTRCSRPATSSSTRPTSSRSGSTSVSTSSSRATSPSASTRGTARRSRCRSGVYPESRRRVMDLQDPEKMMSTTGGNRQGPSTSSTERTIIRRKFKVAVTDSGREILHDADKPGISNLIEIMSVATGESIAAIQARYDGQGYGAFKNEAAEVRVALLEPIQRRFHELRDDPASYSDCSRSEPRMRARRRSRRSKRCTSAWASCASARDRLRPAAPQPRPPSALATRRSRARRRRAPSSECAGGGARGARRPRTCASPGGSDPRGV